MWLAMAGSASMVAHQVAAKAARDGFFLAVFAPSELPKMVVAAALASFVLSILFARITERHGSHKLVPAAFLVSSAMHFGEWMLRAGSPQAVAIVIYLHVVGLGAILMSGFWLLLSEVFDLREAKKRFGSIAGAGTAGGILGGLLSERLVAWFSSDAILLMLALLHLCCTLVAMRFRPGDRRPSKANTGVTIREAFVRTPLLWQLASLVLLGTCTAALLDYLFKLGAAISIGKGPALVRYFAIYYTACQILTFLMQAFVARVAAERLGVARSVASLPVTVGLGATAALLVPVYPFVVGVRALEVIMRGSLFRSGYEFLYTPVPPADKRAVKTIIDVGFDRLGDAVGAGAVQLMIWLGPALARPEILGLAMVLAAVSTWLALRLDSSYRGVLERGLVERAREDESGADEDGSLMNTVFDGMPSIVNLTAPGGAGAPFRRKGRATQDPHAHVQTPPSAAVLDDPSLERLIELRSRDPKRVNRALDPSEPWDPLLVPQVVRLLAWNPVSARAGAYLERGGPRILGQMNDALLDQDVEFSIRRRLPRWLARVPRQQSVDGLLHALEDPRFEIRYQCGRALDYMKRHCPDLDFRSRAIFSAVVRELSVNPSIWTSRRRMEDAGGDSGQEEYLDEVLQERADRSLEHVFSLLAVVLPRDPLMAAFRALHQEDRMFRGLALEYLETVLPEQIRKPLWVVLEESPPATAKEAGATVVLDSLVAMNAQELLRRAAKKSESHAPVLAAEESGDPQPAHRKSHVEPGEAGETD